MNYLAYLFLNHLYSVTEEIRFVDGKEQPCLVIPAESNQLKRGKRGNWLMVLRLREKPPNASMKTHRLELVVLNRSEVERMRSLGILDRANDVGHVYAIDNSPEKKIDRTNNATDIVCKGVIVLDDIPTDLIIRNSNSGKRYVNGLRFEPCSNIYIIYTGAICVDDIPKEHIMLDASTGKKYINVTFKRMPALDLYMNTHHLVITCHGSEIEIGRFKEWVKSGGVAEDSIPKESHNTTINPRPPISIDGIRF